MASETLVSCPACQSQCAYAPSNPYRPFCSQRCRLVDLGRWAQEEFKIGTRADASAENSESK